ncbi:MAG: hypothetical protein Q7U66_11550, partial [Methylobacter sp.]|nr:hypothetical protein [Methylobacter sp.]
LAAIIAAKAAPTNVRKLLLNYLHYCNEVGCSATFLSIFIPSPSHPEITKTKTHIYIIIFIN